MEGIEHRMLRVNGIQMHIAEKGQGPVVLLLHGFPELWYSWRHHISALASHGYRAVAPDLRGYGDNNAPPSPSSYTAFHIVGDLIALIDLGAFGLHGTEGGSECFAYVATKHEITVRKFSAMLLVIWVSLPDRRSLSHGKESGINGSPASP